MMDGSVLRTSAVGSLSSSVASYSLSDSACWVPIGGLLAEEQPVKQGLPDMAWSSYARLIGNP